MCQSSGTCGNATNTNSTLSFNNYSNSTLSFNQFSNSTAIHNSNSLSFNQFSSSTSVTGNTIVLSEQLNVTGAVDVNNTNQTLVPIESFQFLSNKTNSTISNNIHNKTSDSLKLQGSQYVTENSSATSLRSLTISAWVKPDYSQGSSVFTVISDENAFVLAINNNMPPSKVGVFSVFDGIKWTTVQSTSTIPERWTHLAATFNGTSIGIYVNGKLEGTSPIAGIPILVNGDLTTKTVQNLTSNANVTIGAYYEKIRLQTRNLFSGEISSVNLYGLVLTPNQISHIYNSTKPEDSVVYSH